MAELALAFGCTLPTPAPYPHGLVLRSGRSDRRKCRQNANVFTGAVVTGHGLQQLRRQDQDVQRLRTMLLRTRLRPLLCRARMPMHWIRFRAGQDVRMQALASPALAAFVGPVTNRPPEQVQLQFPTQLELPPA